MIICVVLPGNISSLPIDCDGTPNTAALEVLGIFNELDRPTLGFNGAAIGLSTD